MTDSNGDDGEVGVVTQTECTIMECSGDAEFAYWMPGLGHFSKARNPEHDLLDDGDFSPFVCESCRDRMGSKPHWDAERFVRPQEKLVTDGGSRLEAGSDRWKCPGCGKITVDPGAPIAACACGCDRVQLREWPNGPEGWGAPEWPAWSDYSPDPYENESVIVYVGGPDGRHIEEADADV